MIVAENCADGPKSTAIQTKELEGGSVSGPEDAAWLAKSCLITLGGGLASRGLQAASQISLARLLGPASFGLYAIGSALLRVATVVGPLGLNSGVIHCATRYAKTDQRRLGRALGESLALAILFSGLIGFAMCLAAPELAIRVFHKANLRPLIYIFAIGVPLAAGLRVASASTTVSQSMKYSLYTELLLQPAANLTLVFAFYLIGWRLLGAATAAVASFGIALALALHYERRLFPQARFWAGPQKASITRELLQFSLTSWLGTVFASIVPVVDRLFVGAYLMPAEVGIYQAAAQASALLGMIGGGFNAAMAPRISFLFRNSQTERLEQVYKVSTKWAVYTSIPLVLVFCFAPEQVLGALYGRSYAGGAGVLIVLSIMWLIDMFAGPAASLLVFTAHQRLYSVIAGAELVLCATLNYLLIPRFGAIGAALATSLATAAMMLAFVLAVRATAGIWPCDRRWIKGLLAAAPAMGILMFVAHHDVQSPLLGVVLRLFITGAVFVGVLFLLGLDPEDREIITTLRNFVRGVNGDAGQQSGTPSNAESVNE